jgi:hypothetical protein
VVALLLAGVGVAACGSSGPSAQNADSLSVKQANADARSQFSAADRQAATVLAPQAGSFLFGQDTVTTLASTVPANGDTVPAGVWPVSRSMGSLQAGDVLVDNAADTSGALGKGTSVVDVHPDGNVTVFAHIPRDVAGCPGGVGLSSALVQLETGWVLVGSMANANGGSGAGAGCLLVLSPSGALAGTISGSYIDGPSGAALSDGGTTATLFVSNTLVGITGQGSATVDRGDVVRLSLSQTITTKPSVTAEAVVAGGFPERRDPALAVVGPNGLVLDPSGTLYVADTVGDRVAAIPDALHTGSSTGAGTTLSQGGQLAQPRGLVLAPNGDLLAGNSGNGKIVELTPGGHQVGEYYADEDVDQDPPGADELSGLAINQAGTGVLFAKDEANTLELLH